MATRRSPARPSLLTADDRDRVLEIAYDVRYGTIDPPVIRLRSGASVEVAVSADGKAIRLTRIGGPQHGKVTRLAFDPGARLHSGTKRPAGRKTATRRKVPSRKVANPGGLPVRVGDRIELRPTAARWRAGDKFCVVTGVSGAGIDVAFALSGDIRRIQPDLIGRVNGVAVNGVVFPAPKSRSRRVANPSGESPYEVGVRVGRVNAETALESLDDGTMELDDGETRADRVREYAEIASFEQSEDGAEFYDHPEKNGGRYTWEDYERGVRRGIDLALDRDRPVRNPARKRRPKAKRPAARRAPKRRR